MFERLGYFLQEALFNFTRLRHRQLAVSRILIAGLFMISLGSAITSSIDKSLTEPWEWERIISSVLKLSISTANGLLLILGKHISSLYVLSNDLSLILEQDS